jgi:hypothetical protein
VVEVGLDPLQIETKDRCIFIARQLAAVAAPGLFEPKVARGQLRLGFAGVEKEGEVGVKAGCYQTAEETLCVRPNPASGAWTLKRTHVKQN